MPQKQTIDDLSVVRAGIPMRDGCPVLRRIKAFIAFAGVASMLEHVFRDARGIPIDLRAPEEVSEPSDGSEQSASSASESGDAVVLRMQEITALRGQSHTHPIYSVDGEIVDAGEGVVRAALPEEVYKRSAIYMLSWGFVRDGQLRLTNEGLLSVERTLFGIQADGSIGEGPPTINELRMHLADSDPAENNLLADVEFTDDQIVIALVHPLEYFNEVPPRLRRLYDTHDFPWKHHWLHAAIGHLHEIAATKYRRNALAVNAGGMNINDMQKEPEYLRFAEMRAQEWKDFVRAKKLELTMRDACDTLSSPYDGFCL